MDTISLEIRYYKDSFISADEMTRGCSSSSITSSSCFGVSDEETHKQLVSKIVWIVVRAVIEVVCVCGVCFLLNHFCCNNNVKNNPNNNNNNNNNAV